MKRSEMTFRNSLLSLAIACAIVASACASNDEPVEPPPPPVVTRQAPPPAPPPPKPVAKPAPEPVRAFLPQTASTTPQRVGAAGVAALAMAGLLRGLRRR